MATLTNDEKHREQRLIEWIAAKIAEGMTDQAIRDAMIEEADGADIKDESFDKAIEKAKAFIAHRSKTTPQEEKNKSVEYYRRRSADPKLAERIRIRARENLDRLLNLEAQAINENEMEDYTKRAAIFGFMADNTISGISQEESIEILAKRKAEGCEPESSNPFIPTLKEIAEAKDAVPES